MPINNIPGVGPTNADIATAVAAPSSSTIATAVAAAVPTLSQINTSVATNAPSPNGWTLVSSVSPAYASTSITFSGLSGYKTYKLIIPFLNLSGTNGYHGIRINGDTTGNYDFTGTFFASGQTPYSYWESQSASTMSLTGASGGSNGSIRGVITIEHCNLAGAKYINSNITLNGLTAYLNNYQGVYRGTSTVSSITFFNVSGTGTYGNGNTVYLYGAN